MKVRLDMRSIVTGGTLSGMIREAPASGITLSARAKVVTPFGEHTIDAASFAVHDGLFGLPAPTWPLSSDGPVIKVSWGLDVIAPDGSLAATVPFELVRARTTAGADVTIEAIDNDDLDEPHRFVPKRLGAIAATALGLAAIGAAIAFATGWVDLAVALTTVTLVSAVGLAVGYDYERRHTIVHDVHCRVDPAADALDCAVRLQHPDTDLPQVNEITATLLVVESAIWNRPTGGHAEQEEVVDQCAIALRKVDPRTWRGTIDALPTLSAPLSWAHSIELDEWSVCWAVRFVISAADVDDTTHVVHLRSAPSSVDPTLTGLPAREPNALC